MSKFCSICDNLLTATFSDDVLSFVCETCFINYKSNPEDSLRRERIKEVDIRIFSKILDKAEHDPATIKARIKCLNDKCSGTIVKQVRVGQDMRLYNICITCHIQSLN